MPITKKKAIRLLQSRGRSINFGGKTGIRAHCGINDDE